MNPPEWFIGDGNTNNRPSPRKELQLQGPRPAALKVNKDSYKIKKPPIAPNNPPPPQQQQQSQPSTDDNNQRKPVIIYAVSPKVIHTTVTDFMNLVQRLTGNNTSTTASAGDVSPAARLASIEKAATTNSPRNNMDSRGDTTTATTAVGGNTNVSNDADEDIMGNLLQESDVELGRAAPGILSPAPASLPPISPGFFSPAAVDPFMMGSSYFNNMFVPSPSTLFSSPMVSPSCSSVDLFNPFFDF